MNIDELYTVDRHNKGADMQVKDENGKPLDMFLTLAGVDSKLYRKEKIVLSREVLNLSSQENKLDDKLDDLRAEALANTTLGWSGFNDKGKELEFSKDKAKQLYLSAPYIMDQADEFIFKRVNFIKS